MNSEFIVEKINTLHTCSDASQRKEADQILKDFQNSQHAWMFSNEVLQQHKTQQITILLYAAQTLKFKVQHDLHELDGQTCESLKGSLISMLSLTSGNGGNGGFPKIINTQLSLALASLLSQQQLQKTKQQSASIEEWMQVFNQVFSALSGNTRVLLEFLTVLPEEMPGQLVAPCSTQLLQFLLQLYEQHKNDSVTVGAVITCIWSWMHANLIPMDLITQFPLMQIAFTGLKSEDDDVFEPSADLVCEIAVELKGNMSHSSTMNLMQEFYSQLQFITSLIDGADGDTARLKTLTRIHVNIGELYLPFILQQPDQLSHIIQAVLKCTAITDLEIVPMTFNFWGELTDSLIQHQNPNKNQPRDSQENIRDSSSTRLPMNVHPVIIHAYAHLLEIMINHLKYPEGSKQFTATERDDFRDFRHVLGNVLKDCCLVLGEKDALMRPLSVLETITQSTVKPSWQAAEAALFALRALGSEVGSQENEIMPKIMEVILSPDFLIKTTASSQEQQNKIQYAATLVIGRYSDWTFTHPQYIERQLNFISKGFSSDDIAAASALALKYLCESCGSQMIPYLNQLHPFYVQSQNKLSSYEMRELTEAMAYIIQAMPANEISMALQSFCEPLAQELSSLANVSASNTSDSKLLTKKTEDILQRLAIFLKAIRNSSAMTVHPAAELFKKVWPVIETVSNNQRNTDIFEAICKLIKMAIVSIDPKFMVEAMPQVLNYIVQSYQLNRTACFLWVAGNVVKKYAEIYRKHIEEFFKHLAVKAYERFETAESLDFDPDAFEDFTIFMTTSLAYMPYCFVEPIHQHQQTTFLLNCLKVITLGLSRAHYVIQEASIIALRDILESIAKSNSLNNMQDFVNKSSAIVIEAAPHMISALLGGILGANEHGSHYSSGINSVISAIMIYISDITVLINPSTASNLSVPQWSKMYLTEVRKSIPLVKQRVSEESIEAFLKSMNEVLVASSRKPLAASVQMDSLKYSFAGLTSGLRGSNSRRR